MGEMIRMKMSDGADIGVYRAQPEGPRKGGLVLLQEIFGINAHIRQLCDSFAERGYETLAPALFDREVPGFEGDHDHLEDAIRIAQHLHPFALSVADTQSCIDALKAKGPVFVTGFCYGGSVTFRAAQVCTGIAAASSFYGGMVASFADEPVTVPTICHFGRNDPFIPMEGVEQLIAKRPEVKTYVYEAGHGFVSGKPDYNPEAAETALKRTLELFEAHSAM
jgi:carboxymethylenebutenolidase